MDTGFRRYDEKGDLLSFCGVINEDGLSEGPFCILLEPFGHT